MLRQLAKAWVTSNCPHPGLRRDFLNRVDEAERLGSNCYFVIGPKSTKKRQAYLVHLHGGELFAFALTSRQATNMGAMGADMISTFTSAVELVPNDLPCTITAECLEIDGAGTVPVTGPFRGRLHYEMTGSYAQPWCLGLDYALRDATRVTQWSMPDVPLMPQAAIEFSFPELGKRNDMTFAPWRGTFAVFVALYAMPNSSSAEGRVPISNRLAKLIDLV